MMYLAYVIALASQAPTVALGPGFTPVAFAPGRYATVIQRTMQGTHALQVLNEDSTASLVVDLAADGNATACRGWRYVFHNDGPEIHTEDNYREQQGYRGRYTVVDGVAELVLARDNRVCPHLFQGGLKLPRAATLKLRCALATPSGTSSFTRPALLCQSVGARPSELDPYVVDELAPSGWLPLGSGNGLRVRMTGRPAGARAGDDLKITAKVADAPLGVNAWDQSF
jgi:hypothetical protein